MMNQMMMVEDKERKPFAASIVMMIRQATMCQSHEKLNFVSCQILTLKVSLSIQTLLV